MAKKNCISNIVGYSLNDNFCTFEGRPDHYNESLSGLVLDDSAGINFNLLKTTNCQPIWEQLTKDRDLAIQEVLMHLNRELSKKQKKVDQISASFGVNDASTSNACDSSLDHVYAGFTFSAKKYKGLSWKPTRFTYNVDRPGKYEICIYRLRDLQKANMYNPPKPVALFESHSEGKFCDTAVSLKGICLPLSCCGTPVCYVLLIKLNGAKTLNYNAYCAGCYGSKPEWARKELFNVQGFALDELYGFKLSSCKRGQLTGGLKVDWKTVCDPMQWICSQDCDFFTLGNWGEKLAYVIKKKWAWLSMVSALENKPFFQATNFSSTNAILHKIKAIKKEYMGNYKLPSGEITMGYIETLCESLPEDTSDCWTCMEDNYNFINEIVEI